MLPSRRFGATGGEHDYSADTKLGRGATRLEVAHRLFLALMAQDPDRLITLRDGSGQVVARHDPRPEQG